MADHFRLIKRIEVKYFRSLYTCTMKNCGDLNLIFGRNDSGKSNVLKALNLFFNDDLSAMESLNFERDFSDIRSKEAYAAKGKKFISVKIEFNVPSNYEPSLGKVVTVKRQWNIQGERTEYPPAKLTTGAKIQLSKLLNQIDYSYVPAIKDVEVFSMLTERMYDAAANQKVLGDAASQFVGAIRRGTASLSKRLETRLDRPSLLGAPANMAELFRTLDFRIDGHSLLEQKGDGVKASHIPPLLKFINENDNSKKFFLWGFEEPENSLDLENASHEAKMFANYSSASNTQIFLTSHSPAFYLAESEDKDCLVKRYFISRQNKNGEVSPSDAATDISKLEDAETSMENASLLRLPYLIRQLSERDKEVARLSEVILDMEKKLDFNKPTIFVEGTTDELIYAELLKKKFPEKEAKVSIVTMPSMGGGDNYCLDMLAAWRLQNKHAASGAKAAAVIDIDLDSNGQFVDRAGVFNSQSGVTHSCKAFSPRPPKPIQAALKKGFKIPKSLEVHYPLLAWSYASGKGWLEKANIQQLLPSKVAQKVLNGEESLQNSLDEEWAMQFQFRVSGSKKMKLAKHVVGKTEALNDGSLEELGHVLETVMNFLEH